MAPNITEWLALYDHLNLVYRARDHPGVDAAFLALATHDHTLTTSDRIAARIARWRRDSPELLPSETERAWWGHCLCRACAAARRASVGTLAPWQRQQRTLQQQKSKQQRKGYR